MKTTRNIRSLRSQGFTLIELLVVISIIAILAGFALPVFSSAQKKGRMTDSLNNAKQIGTAMKMYAGDHDGQFPSLNTAGAALVTSNDAYENLMPKYSSSKKIFPNKNSYYCKAPQTVTAESTAVQYQLPAGHNDWGYMIGLGESSDARYALGFTAPDAAATGNYVQDTNAAGGVWAASNAVIIYVDGSAKLETCADTAGVAPFYVPRPDDKTKNLLIAAGTWMSASNTILVPLP